MTSLIHPRRSLDLHSFMFHVIAFVVVPSRTLPVSAMHHLPSISFSFHCPHCSTFAVIGQEHSFIRISQPIRDLNRSKSPNSFRERTAHLSTSGLPVITLGSCSSILNLALDTLIISSLPKITSLKKLTLRVSAAVEW
jgi:hypothetical protein